MLSFVGEVRSELTKVTWPTRNDVVNLTITILGVSLIVGAYLGALDYVFTLMLEFLIS